MSSLSRGSADRLGLRSLTFRLIYFSVRAKWAKKRMRRLRRKRRKVRTTPAACNRSTKDPIAELNFFFPALDMLSPDLPLLFLFGLNLSSLSLSFSTNQMRARSK